MKLLNKDEDQAQLEQKFKKDIAKLTKKEDLIERELKTYARENRTKAAVAFAQFESMSAKIKFMKAMKLTWFQRTFQAEKFKAKK